MTVIIVRMAVMVAQVDVPVSQLTVMVAQVLRVSYGVMLFLVVEVVAFSGSGSYS